MKAKVQILRALLLVCFCVPTSKAQTTADLQVSAYQLVSSTRLDRTRFEYAYRIVVQNTSSAFATNAHGVVRSVAAATQVVDGDIFIGDVPPGAQRLITDTVVVRHDRLVPFITSNLGWTFTADLIQGATPPPDPGEQGTLTLAGIDSNANGVRDDVERVILIRHPTSQIRNALFEYARIWQDAFTGQQTTELAFAHMQRLTNSIACVYELDRDSGRLSLKRLLAEQLNTRERTYAYLRFDTLASSQLYTIPGATQASSQCPTGPF